jgi:hypothetical protein
VRYCKALQHLSYDVVTAEAVERGIRLMQRERRLEKR